MKIVSLTFLLWLTFLTTAFAAPAPLGDFRCAGKGENGQTYKGYVKVEKSGEVYTVLWRFGEKVYVGTGIVQGETFSVAFLTQDRQWFGLAVFTYQQGRWVGRWTRAGGDKLSIEVWEKF